MLNIFTSIQNQDQRFDLMIIKIIYDTNKWVLRVPILCHSAGVYTEFSTLSVTENRFEKLPSFLLISIIVKFQITLLECIRVHYQILLYISTLLSSCETNKYVCTNIPIIARQLLTTKLFSNKTPQDTYFSYPVELTKHLVIKQD